MCDGFVNALGHFILGQIGNGTVQGGCANKCMNAGLGRMAHRFGAAINIFEIGTGKAANHGVFAAFCDVADGLEVSF